MNAHMPYPYKYLQKTELDRQISRLTKSLQVPRGLRARYLPLKKNDVIKS
jgi:hypothetical protein